MTATPVLRRWRRSIGTVEPTHLVLVGGVGAVAAVFAYLMEHGSYDSFAAIPVGAALLALSLPLLRRAAGIETDVRIVRILYLALPLKLAASLVRYYITFGLYDGQADAASYHREGARIAVAIRALELPVEIGRPLQGTGFIRVLTGCVYSLTGATSIGGFLVFSWFGFWGLYCMYRAFVRACPNGDHHRYALLVFLLPSLLFWPSSVGKEAWVTLALGLMALGAARMLSHGRGGLSLLLLGGVGTAVVRPHVTALFAAAVVFAYIFRRAPSNASILHPIGKLIGIVVLGALAVVAIGQLEDYLGVDAFNQESVATTLEEVTRQTGQGGSEFVSSTTVDPRDIPIALAALVVRPFPWEASNIQSLLSSLEGVLLAVMFFAGWRRVVGALGACLRTPYVLLCCTYILLFSYGFSSFSNFGILVRQRVQVLPFIIVLLCVEPIRGRLRDAPRELILARERTG